MIFNAAALPMRRRIGRRPQAALLALLLHQRRHQYHRQQLRLRRRIEQLDAVPRPQGHDLGLRPGHDLTVA